MTLLNYQPNHLNIISDNNINHLIINDYNSCMLFTIVQ